LDGRFAEWIGADRPGNDTADIWEQVFTQTSRPIDPMPSIEQVMRDLKESVAKKGYASTVTSISDMPRSHAALDLEVLLPADLGMDVSSDTAAQWGDSKLRGALKRLKISDREAFVANGIGKAEGGVLTAIVYSVPGVAARALDAEFTSVMRVPDAEGTDTDVVGDRRLHRSRGVSWVAAWWPRDGMVVSCSAPDPAALADLVARLP